MIGLILAGGSGTRLQTVVKDKPKPMADVAGRPFIRYITEYLFSNGFKKIYISCFHMADQIENEYRQEILSGKIQIITEPKKLGTGGAIFYCLDKIFHSHTGIEDIFVCNGDSFVDFKPQDFFVFHQKNYSKITIVSVIVHNTGRYGTLEIDTNNNIVSFKEKAIKSNESIAEEPINAGVYIINKDLLFDFKNLLEQQNEFSFETEILTRLATNKTLKTFCLGTQNFIDIGIPEDYMRAQEIFAK
jgi:D-glycero-alpha-D-manno-heptose 1-phosphate guanylyltransferase